MIQSAKISHIFLKVFSRDRKASNFARFAVSGIFYHVITSSQTSTKGEAAILKFSPHDIITLHYMKVIIADDCNIFQLSNFQPCNVFSYNQLSNFPQPCSNYNYLKNTAAWLKPEPSTLFLWDYVFAKEFFFPARCLQPDDFLTSKLLKF